MERKVLGRGLSSLLGSTRLDEIAPRILDVPIDEIRANTQQPRQEWDEEALRELADSIRSHGILQPLIVRGRPGDYELVAGERRLRAARMAGLTHVPSTVRDADDARSLQLALIENLQRENLSPLDAAHAYGHLTEDFSMTQEEVAQAVGRSRPTITNALRLLRLPLAIQESLRVRAITEGHARTLLAVEEPAVRDRLWKMALDGASVRDLEAAVKKGRQPASNGPEAAKSTASLQTVVRRSSSRAPHLEDLEARLRRVLGTKVEIRGDENTGMLCIDYYSDEDLQALTVRLLGDAAVEVV